MEITERPATTTPLLTVTERAAEKIKQLLAEEEDVSVLRVAIQGGGCSGFQYGFTFDEKHENDAEFAQGEVRVVVDPQSAMYLKGASVDYLEDFRGAGFSVTNPNASGGCGCGKSFNA